MTMWNARTWECSIISRCHPASRTWNCAGVSLEVPAVTICANISFVFSCVARGLVASMCPSPFSQTRPFRNTTTNVWEYRETSEEPSGLLQPLMFLRSAVTRPPHHRDDVAFLTMFECAFSASCKSDWCCPGAMVDARAQEDADGVRLPQG